MGIRETEEVAEPEQADRDTNEGRHQRQPLAAADEVGLRVLAHRAGPLDLGTAARTLAPYSSANTRPSHGSNAPHWGGVVAPSHAAADTYREDSVESRCPISLRPAGLHARDYRPMP
jgi:hypothetical protein